MPVMTKMTTTLILPPLGPEKIFPTLGPEKIFPPLDPEKIFHPPNHLKTRVLN